MTMRDILGKQIRYLTCPRVLEEETIRIDSYGNSERRMVVRYMVMDVNNNWYNAVGTFVGSDFPDRVWKDTEWLSIEEIPK